MGCIEALAGLTLLSAVAVAQQAPMAGQHAQQALQATKQSPLIAQDAWIRATPGVDTAAVYLTLRNTGTSAVTVTGVESPIAAHAMIHETSIQGGLSRMRPRERLVVAAHSTVKFGPGGLHIMLHELKQPLTAGQNVPLLIKLEDGSSVAVQATVRPLSAE